MKGCVAVSPISGSAPLRAAGHHHSRITSLASFRDVTRDVEENANAAWAEASPRLRKLGQLGRDLKPNEENPRHLRAR
jgi:hypothetical protein